VSDIALDIDKLTYFDSDLHRLRTVKYKAINLMISLLISRKFFQFLSLSSSDSRSPTALVLKRENQLTFSFLFLRFNYKPLDL